MNRSLYVAGVVALLAAVAVALTPAAPEVQPVSNPARAVVEGPRDRAPMVERGARYGFEIRARVALDDAAFARLEADGELELHRLTLADGRVGWAARFASSASTLTAGGQIHRLALDEGWWAMTPDRHGAIDALRWEGADPLGHAVRSILASEWVDPQARPAERRWRRMAHDAYGRYPAAFVRTAGDVERRRAPYVELAPAVAEGGAVTLAVRGSSRAVAGEGPWPVEVDAEMSATFGAPEDGARGPTTVTHVHLTLLDTAALDEAPDALRRRVEALPARGLSLPAPAPGEIERGLVRGTTLSTWLDACGAAAAGDARVSEALVGLVAWLTVHPEDAPQVVAAVAAAQDEGEAEVLIGALGSTAAPAAERALMALAADPALSIERRRRAVVELGLREAPAADVLDTLATTVEARDEGLRDAAVLATGSVAAGLAELDPAATQRAVDGIVERFDATDDPAQRRALLLALGNAGDDAALPPVMEALDEGDPMLRAAAMRALRSLGEAADPLIAEHLARDEDVAVRRAAARTLADRPLDRTLDALDDAFGPEPDRGVRRAMVDAAAAHLPDPRAVAWLSDALARELDPDLQAALADLLAADARL